MSQITSACRKGEWSDVLVTGPMTAKVENVLRQTAFAKNDTGDYQFF
jgi:hypothetical protein